MNAGRPEPFLKRYATPIQTLMTLGLYVEQSVLGGIAAAPGLWLFGRVELVAAAWPAWPRLVALGTGAFLGYLHVHAVHAQHRHRARQDRVERDRGTDGE